MRLPNLSIYYEPEDTQPAPASRTDFGLRPNATIYWCGQSLFKYLPQFDQVFPQIARQAGDCQFAFIENDAMEITNLFRRRLEQVFATYDVTASNHCVFLPRLDARRFVASLANSDIFLDSIAWSGCNTILESLPHNLPIVIMAGNLMRGRHGTAILKMMDVTETITETIVATSMSRFG